MLPDQFDNEFHKSIVDNLADGVYYVDPGRKINYWNHGAERITGYSSEDVVGHRCFDNILDHVDAEGNSLCHTICPLAATMRDGQPREVSVWLRHAEGYRKPVRVRTSPVRDTEGEIVGAVEVFSDDSAVLRAVEDADRARRDALTDDLTGLPNRRLFDAALAGRIENLSRYGWQFGLLIVDIDHFKVVNDKHGHKFGDRVLAGVAATVHGATRAGDVVARWGGEEFAVLVEASDEAGLIETAERLRALVAQSETRFDGVRVKVHVSAGPSRSPMTPPSRSFPAPTPPCTRPSTPAVTAWRSPRRSEGRRGHPAGQSSASRTDMRYPKVRSRFGPYPFGTIAKAPPGNPEGASLCT
jgi:diguanylate cyclase (GGDEF)-like protein/PAS domain S-box-containing protein